MTQKYNEMNGNWRPGRTINMVSHIKNGQKIFIPEFEKEECYGTGTEHKSTPHA